MSKHLGPIAAALLGVAGSKFVSVYDVDPSMAYMMGSLTIVLAYLLGRYFSPR